MNQTYTLWRCCSNCRALSNPKRSSCRNCGMPFLTLIITTDEAPGGKTEVE